MRFIGGEYDIEARIEYVEDGTRLKEHGSRQKPPEDRPMGYQQTKGYLEMEEGKKFRICVKVHKPARRVNDLSIRLFVDGRNFHSEIYEYDEEEVYERCKVYMTGPDGSQATGRLQFSAMAKTDEEAEADVPQDRIDELCSIVVLITEGRSVDDGRMAVQTASSIGKVYEKHLKLASTISSVGVATQKTGDREASARFDAMLKVSVTDVKPTEYRYASKFQLYQKVCSFVWKYYTRDVLEIKGHLTQSHPDELPSTSALVPTRPRPHIRPGSRIRAELASNRLFRQASAKAKLSSAGGSVSVRDILTAQAELRKASLRSATSVGQGPPGRHEEVAEESGKEQLPAARSPLWGPEENEPGPSTPSAKGFSFMMPLKSEFDTLDMPASKDDVTAGAAEDAGRKTRKANWLTMTSKEPVTAKRGKASEGEAKRKHTEAEEEDSEEDDDPDKTLVESPLKKVKMGQAEEVVVDLTQDIDVEDDP